MAKALSVPTENNLRIRKLAPRLRNALVRLLDIQDGWKELMAIIPTEQDETVPKYKVEHIQTISSASQRTGRSPSDILLDEWGTSGRRQPDVTELLQLLVEAQLFRVAEFVAEELLKCPFPQRPEKGPAASVDTSTKILQRLQLDSRDAPHTQIEAVNPIVVPCINDLQNIWLTGSLETNLPHVPVHELSKITDNFCEIPVKKCGRKLGEGAFGTVYLGILPSQLRVAVKKLHADASQLEQQFQNEVNMLKKYEHKNIVPILGYSCDGPQYCLVYSFMCNGSLQDRLECVDATPPLLWQRRIRIAYGTAEGIVHLHTLEEKPLVHRDIKSANVLLDSEFNAKIGDFGLARIGATGEKGHSVALTTTIFGTSAYMAPEAFRGDISVKLDVFSFGVVLLELLTGLKPYDEEREGFDLVTHIDEMCEDGDITSLLDTKAGDWPVFFVKFCHSLSQQCLEEKKQRPSMVQVFEELDRYLQREKLI